MEWCFFLFNFSADKHIKWRGSTLLLSTLHMCCWYREHSEGIQRLSRHHSENASASIWVTVIFNIKLSKTVSLLWEQTNTWRDIKKNCLCIDLTCTLYKYCTHLDNLQCIVPGSLTVKPHQGFVIESAYTTVGGQLWMGLHWTRSYNCTL